MVVVLDLNYQYGEVFNVMMFISSLTKRETRAQITNAVPLETTI
jgi:hypothetical protein